MVLTLLLAGAHVGQADSITYRRRSGGWIHSSTHLIIGSGEVGTLLVAELISARQNVEIGRHLQRDAAPEPARLELRDARGFLLSALWELAPGTRIYTAARHLFGGHASQDEAALRRQLGGHGLDAHAVIEFRALDGRPLDVVWFVPRARLSKTFDTRRDGGLALRPADRAQPLRLDVQADIGSRYFSHQLGTTGKTAVVKSATA